MQNTRSQFGGEFSAQMSSERNVPVRLEPCWEKMHVTVAMKRVSARRPLLAASAVFGTAAAMRG